MLAAVFELSMQLETECFGVSDIVVEPACQLFRIKVICIRMGRPFLGCLFAMFVRICEFD